MLVGRIAETLLLTGERDQRLAWWAADSLLIWGGAAEDFIEFIFESTLIVRRRI